MGKGQSTYWKPFAGETTQSAVIIGAGAIGVEFATVWNSMGWSHPGGDAAAPGGFGG